MIERRERFQRRMRSWPAEKLVFIDESGLNLSLTRSEAWGPRGERVVDHVPGRRWETYSIIAALRTKGVIAPMLIPGAMNTDAFRVWVCEVLAPELRRGDIVVLDNLGIHDDPEVREALALRGVRLEFLPPYSPDLNPIEPAWSKMKCTLRAAKARVFDALVHAVDEALTAIAPSDSCGWFQHCGYATT